MKNIQTTFGRGSETYLRPELTTTDVAVESGFAATETYPGGDASPLSRTFDDWGDPIEE